MGPSDRDLLAIADARASLHRARAAFASWRRADQALVDRVCAAVVERGAARAEELARAAVEETGIGHVPGKTAKNLFATRELWRRIERQRTCGLLRRDDERGIREYGDPFGVVAAIIPTTNPTSTALFKAIICLKSRNAMVASPHPRAARCIRAAVALCQEAAEEAGAPPGLLNCLETVDLAGTRELMHHRECDLVLATGGSALVKAAYSSGKPAFGVGPGNVPVFVHRSADVARAARALVESQTFDYGTICSSEQAVVAEEPVADALLDELRALGAHVCTPEERRLLEAAAIRDGVTNPRIVGIAAPRLAECAGFTVPEDTTVLLAPHAPEEVGREHPLSLEKLCPLLAFYRVPDEHRGCDLALRILGLGGRGHTLGIHAEDERLIEAFALEKPANRIVVNAPTSQGAVGYATHLFPSMTLGCGSFGGNITSDNIGPHHLLNVKRVAFVRPEWGRVEAAGQMGGSEAERAWPEPSPTPSAAGEETVPDAASAAFDAPRWERPHGDSGRERSRAGEEHSPAEWERLLRAEWMDRRDRLDREDGRPRA